MENWVKVATLSDLKSDCGYAVEVQGTAIALVQVDGQVYAVNDTCTHADASLCDGMLDGEELECPLHFARFNVKTGAVTAPPATCPLKTYQVRVVDQDIEINYA